MVLHPTPNKVNAFTRLTATPHYTDTTSVCVCIFVCALAIINLVNTHYVKIWNAPFVTLRNIACIADVCVQKPGGYCVYSHHQIAFLPSVHSQSLKYTRKAVSGGLAASTPYRNVCLPPLLHHAREGIWLASTTGVWYKDVGE